MENFEPKIYEKKETAKKYVKPPENLPTKRDVVIEFDTKEIIRDRAVEIGLKDEEEINFFVDVAEKESDMPENQSLVFGLARKMIEDGGGFCESMELFEYYGSYPRDHSASRKEFKEFAESARRILESKRDESLLPFDEKTEFKKLREERKDIVAKTKKGLMTREQGLKISRDHFEEFKKERDWQRDGMEYFQIKIIEDMLAEMKTSAGVSALEGRMILENPRELEEFVVKNGLDSAIKLLEVPEGDSDRVGDRLDFFYHIGDEIEKKAKYYRITDEQKSELVINTAALMNKRADARKNKTIKEITGSRGLNPRNFEIISTPFVFYIRCGDEGDYAALYTGKKREEIAKKEIEHLKNSGGFYSGKNYLVEKNIGEDKTFNIEKFEVFIHEEQHFFDKMFQKRTEYQNFSDYLDDAWAILAIQEIDEGGKKDLKETNYEISRALRKFREYECWRAASEFLAFFRIGANLEYIVELLKKEKKQGGGYDYFKEETREAISNYITENFDEIGCDEARETVNQVLVEEYGEILDDATEAIKLLTNEKFKISKDRVIIFLQALPLQKWLSKTRKFLKRKEIKNI